MNILFKSIAIVLSLSAGLQAMEVEGESESVKSEQGQMLQEDKRIGRTSTQKENAHKMWLLKQAIDEEKLPWLPEELKYVIGGKLHELYLYENPVLRGELVYTGKPEKRTFKIGDLLKEDGCIDLSNKQIFEDSSEQVFITTDPAMFFHFDATSIKLAVLIAPKFLIEEKIETTASNFKPIMDKWNVDLAPIGLFYRMQRWNDLSCYYYLVAATARSLSKNDLFENLCAARWVGQGTHYPQGCGRFQKFHALFNLN